MTVREQVWVTGVTETATQSVVTETVHLQQKEMVPAPGPVTEILGGHGSVREQVGMSQTFQVIDSNTPPVPAPLTYLRFVRDVDGDVQQIILGTVN